MLTHHHLSRWQAIAARAYASGAEVTQPAGPRGPARLRWNLAGKCQSPVYREVVGAQPYVGWENTFSRRDGASNYVPEAVSRKFKRGPQHVLELYVRCRKCPQCLRAKAQYWRIRAFAELSANTGRSWFGTLTMTPHEHFRTMCAARLRLAGRGVSWDALPLHEQFAERCLEAGKSITRYLKRIRKESGAKLRYILVAEAHKSGLPHWHILIHEVGDQPVRHSTLKKQWGQGFSDFKLVAEHESSRAAYYVAKYLTKSASARVRASRGYGHSRQHGLSHNLTEGQMCEKKLTHELTGENSPNIRTDQDAPEFPYDAARAGPRSGAKALIAPGPLSVAAGDTAVDLEFARCVRAATSAASRPAKSSTFENALAAAHSVAKAHAELAKSASQPPFVSARDRRNDRRRMASRES